MGLPSQKRDHALRLLMRFGLSQNPAFRGHHRVRTDHNRPLRTTLRHISGLLKRQLLYNILRPVGRYLFFQRAGNNLRHDSYLS